MSKITKTELICQVDRLGIIQRQIKKLTLQEKEIKGNLKKGTWDRITGSKFYALIVPTSRKTFDRDGLIETLIAKYGIAPGWFDQFYSATHFNRIDVKLIDPK